MKKFYIFLFLSSLFVQFLFVGGAWGQVTVTATTGTATGTFTTLKGAFDAINAGTHTGSITLSIVANTTETATAALNASGSGSASYTAISIQPSGGAARTISGAIASGSPLIDLNGADNVTINGLNTGGNSLTISNTTIGSATASSTIRFFADATSNTIQNCTIQGSATINGVVFFSSGTTSGNDNNNINNCNISAAGSNFPLNGILSTGTSSTIDNSGNTLNSNNIFDYFSAGSATVGINLTATGNSAWTITDNKLYQTATRTYTSAFTHNGIFVGIGSGYTISGNVIGFANSSGTGTMNLVGNSVALSGFPTSYTTTGTPNATRFIAINCAFTAAGTNSIIRSNTIAGIALHTSSGAASANAVLCGINVSAGNVTIGGSNPSDGNIIGTTTGPTSGIYSVFVSSTSASAAIAPIYATSANTVSIQNNKVGDIMSSGFSSSTASGFKGIDVAGAGNFSITNNTIGNDQANNIRTGYYLTTTNLSNAANTATTATGTSTVIGIQSTMTGNILAINNNTIKGIQISGSTTSYIAINSSGTMTGTNPNVNINSNALGNSTLGWVTYAVANSGALTGISLANTTATIHNINSNDFRGITYALAGTNAHTYINFTGGVSANNVSTINSNTFTNLSVNTTGSVVFINHNYIIPSTGQCIINNNSIVNAFTRLAAGSITLTSTNSTSGNGSVNNYTNNNFSNIIVPDNLSSTIIGFNNTDGGTGSTKTITGNTFNNWHGGTVGTTGTSSTINCMNITYWNGVSSLSNNTITNITGRSTITGMTLGSVANLATTVNVSSNTINNLASIGTGGQVLAISCSNTSPTININGNTINNLSSTGASSAVGGITVFSATTTNVFQNVIFDISTSGATAPIALGIQVAGGTSVNVYRNKVYNLSASGGALTSSASAVSGIFLNGGATVNTYNNLIGNLSAPNINLADAIRGINIISTASGSQNVYNNTVYLTGGSVGTNFGTSGIHHAASATTSTAVLDLQNNMIFNTCTPSGTGIVTAFRRSAATLGNYRTTSNRNLFYAGTPSANTTIMSDGTNNYQTLATFQTAVSPREVNSFTEATFNPATYFASTTGSNANYLQPTAGLSSHAESGGNTIAICSPDYNGVTRPGAGASAYDIGAWEFSGAVCTAPTSLAATASSNAQTTTTISGVFTAAATAPNSYLVVRTATNSQPTPVTGTTYTVGTNAIGFIEYVGTTAGAWTSTGLTTATTYYYWVFSYNNAACSGGPVYSATTTNFSESTITCPATSLDGLSYSSNPASYCLSSAITPNTATLASSTIGITYSVSPSLPTGLALSSSTGTISGTPTVVTAAEDYTVTANNGCTSTTVAVNIAIVALPTTLVATAATPIAPFSFSANWPAGSSATSYFLDVATDNTFTTLVSGFNGLNVGNVLTYSVTGLLAGNTYFYRVRYTNGTCTSLNSNTVTATTSAITSIATGNWNATTTWNSGTIPTCGDFITIASTHNVTVNSPSNVSRNLTIASGGTLTVASGDLTVGCTLNNTPLSNSGTLTVSGGTLNVNGNIISVLGSTFNQSGGNINIDGNAAGNATNSVASGTALLQFNQLNSGINLTGGTLTIVDPHANATSTLAIGYNNSTAGSQTSTVNHTLRLGDGISTDAGGNVVGFRIDPWTGTAYLSFGNIIINGGSGINRSVTIAQSIAAIGDVTVTTGSTLNLNLTPSLFVAGNVTVNSGGTFINTSGIISGLVASNTISALTFSPSTFAQTIGGSGTYQNFVTSPTASLTNLTINNTSSSGVTISTPLSISGTLTMTAGKINTTASNLLTLGTTSAAGTLAYTAGQIAGPFARTFATSSTSTASYDATTLFPVGDGTNYTPIHIDPVNGAGPVVMRGQAFNTNSGQAGIGMASPLSNDRWEALVTSGSSNLTSCFVGLNDAQIATGNLIAQSASANGVYNAVAQGSTFVSGTPSALRTTAAIPAASYTGFFTYAAPGPAITSFLPVSACPNAVTTITITGTNLGSATSVTLNGEACAITLNSSTSITFTTDASPQAGNIVVTTAANSATSSTALTLFTLPTVTASSNAVNNTICSGSNVTLNGGGATTYTWNNSVVNNTAFAPISTNSFTVTGTDVNGCNNTASITITVNDAVSISSQPTDQVVLPNDNAVFSVTAAGTGVTYQWQESTNNGVTWSNVSIGGIYSGVTSASLTLSNVASENGYKYRCIVSGTTPCGSITSDAATLTISNTSITAQPQNQSICSTDGTATFSITTIGNLPSYQWQFSTNNGVNWSDLASETDSILNLSGLTTTNNSELYRCLLDAGSIVSNIALLTVSSPSVSGTVSANQGICANNSPTDITLTGSTGSIQWQISTDNIAFSNIANATSSTLTSLAMGSLSNTRYYRAIVTSGACAAETSEVVTVTVTPTPNAGTLSGTQNVCINSTTSFSSNGNSGGTWTSSNLAVATVDASTGVVSGISAGSATITYTITGAGGCSTVSSSRGVTVNALPNITSATATPSTVCSGSSVSLSATSVSVLTGTATLGNGTAQGSNSSTFVRVGNTVGNQFKNQYLFTASELTAAGLMIGNISSLTFDVFVSGGGTVSNLTFGLGTTALTNLTSSYVTGLTQVYNVATYPITGTLQAGLQTVTFTTPYYWDGTSNLVLEACSQLATSGTSGDLRSGSTTFVSTITNSPSTTACGSSTGFGTVSVRPNFRFGGQVGTNQTSSLTWSWNSTPAIATASGSTTETNTSGSATTKTYTVTATNATTGCSNTATTTAITINPAPTAPTANNSSQCGSSTPTCSVTGTGTVGNTFKWYTVATGGTALTGQTAATLSSYPVSATTSFFVSESNGTCESARVQVTVTVTAAPTITASASLNPICSGSATVLSVTSANSGYTYSWNISGGTGSSVTVTPSSTTTYTVTGTDASGGVNDGCSATASIAITTNAIPTTITLTPATSSNLCLGDVRTIVASGGNVVSQGNVTLGTGTSTLSTTASYAAFNGYRFSSWIQTIYTASELSALGLVAGNINSIAYNINSQGSSTSNNITIKIGTISATNFTTSTLLSTSLFTTVFGPSAYIHTASGWQIINFATPYNWDGVSNIIVDVWQDGPDGSSDPATFFSTTSDNKVNYTFNVTPSATPPIGFSTSSRFNVRFNGNINTPQPISWSPTASLFTNSAATTTYTGNPTTVFAKPTTTTTYIATATTTAGCTSSASVAVNVVLPSTQTLATNDYVWRGTTNTAWSTPSNWVQYNGTTYTVASTTPAATDNVFIPQNNTCVVNQPSIGTGTVAAKAVYIEPSATVTGGSGGIDVKGDFTNNGTFTAGTGTVNFKGSVAQTITGSTTFNNLSLDNTAGLTLNNPVTIAGNLTMTAGNITTSSTNLLTIGNSAPATLTWTNGKIVGPMKRWMVATTNSGASSSIFPVGSATRNAKVNLEYTVAPTTAGYLEAKYIATNPTVDVAYPTPLTDQFNYLLENVDVNGYWEIAPSTVDGVDGGKYTLTVQADGISPLIDYQNYRIIKSPMPHTEWVLQGTHLAGAGSNSDFTVARTDMSDFSFFALAVPVASLLPVELVSYAANCNDNNTVSIDWTTASEHNSAYYTVEKSRDGLSWNALATIVAAGNSTQLINYSVADASDISGTVYYRLTQVDVDGATKVYDVVSSSCSSDKELALLAYPNPSNGQFTVKIENAVGGSYTLGITDMQGKAIEQQNIQLETGTTVLKMNPVGLNPGVYLLQLVNAGKIEKQLKLVVN